MTRRSALVVSALTLGALVRAQAQHFVSQGLTWKPLERTPLSFDLAEFSEYRFIFGAETVTFTPAEIMAALKPCEHEPIETRWREEPIWKPSDDPRLVQRVEGALRSAPFEIKANDIALYFCRKCGQVYTRKT